MLIHQIEGPRNDARKSCHLSGARHCWISFCSKPCIRPESRCHSLQQDRAVVPATVDLLLSVVTSPTKRFPAGNLTHKRTVRMNEVVRILIPLKATGREKSTELPFLTKLFGAVGLSPGFRLFARSSGRGGSSKCDPVPRILYFSDGCSGRFRLSVWGRRRPAIGVVVLNRHWRVLLVQITGTESTSFKCWFA